MYLHYGLGKVYKSFKDVKKDYPDATSLLDKDDNEIISIELLGKEHKLIKYKKEKLSNDY